MPVAALEMLADAASVKTHGCLSYLYTIGEKSTNLFCVVTGRVRIGITSISGQEFAIVDLEGEYWTGEGSLVGDEPRVIHAQVIEPAAVLILPRRTVLAVGED